MFVSSSKPAAAIFLASFFLVNIIAALRWNNSRLLTLKVWKLVKQLCEMTSLLKQKFVKRGHFLRRWRPRREKRGQKYCEIGLLLDGVFCVLISEFYIYLEWDLRVTEWSQTWRPLEPSELNVDNWNDNCEAKTEAKSPRPLRGLQVDFSLTRNVSYAVCR